jgi:uncharacterized protein YaiI (UPF0178 family)
VCTGTELEVTNNKIPVLRISAQNCQSLNVSTKSDKTAKKILALLKDKDDIVLVSDIKLNSLVNSHALHDLDKKNKLCRL